jgi:hypothetical protein
LARRRSRSQGLCPLGGRARHEALDCAALVVDGRGAVVDRAQQLGRERLGLLGLPAQPREVVVERRRVGRDPLAACGGRRGGGPKRLPQRMQHGELAAALHERAEVLVEQERTHEQQRAAAQRRAHAVHQRPR